MRAVDRLASGVMGRPRVAILASVLVTLVMAAGLMRLEFSTDYRVFFDETGDQRQALDRFERRFGLGEGVVIVLRPKTGDVFSRPFLVALRTLQRTFLADPAVVRAESILDLPVKRIREGFPEVEEILPANRPVTLLAAREVRARALGDPTARGRLVRADGGAVAIFMDVSSRRDLRGVVARLRSVEQSFRKAHPGIQTGLTGIALLNDGFIDSTIRDLTLFLPLTFGALILIMLLYLRRTLGVLGTLSVVGMAAAGAMGMAGWLGLSLTPAGAGAPIVIMTIAIADSIHLLTTFQRRRAAGAEKAAALLASYRINARPIFLTSLTTLIGLLSLNFSDAPPFRDLGNVAAIGIALAFVHSLVFLPALIALWPSGPSAAPIRRQTRAMDRLASLTVRRPRVIVLSFLVAGAGLAAMVPRLEINDVYFRYLDESLPVRQGTEFNLATLPSTCTLHWTLDHANVLDRGFLQRVDGFARWLRTQSYVRHVLNPVDFVRRESGGRLPTDARRTLEILQGARAEAKDPGLIDRLFTRDGRALHLMATLKESSSRDLRRIAENAQTYLRRIFPGLKEPAATGPCVLFANIAETNIRSMLWGTLIAFLLVSLTLLAALRRLWLGALSLVPNLLPPVMAFGLWALLVGEVGLAASLTAATALGIIVDATIHLITRYQLARNDGQDVDSAIHNMLAGVGAAVWVSATVVMAGFAVLALSSFQVNRDVGLLTLLTLAAALLTDLLLLPALLKLCDRGSSIRAPRS